MTPRERALFALYNRGFRTDEELLTRLEAVIVAAVAAETERCALLADEQARYGDGWGAAASVIATNIRAIREAPPPQEGT